MHQCTSSDESRDNTISAVSVDRCYPCSLHRFIHLVVPFKSRMSSKKFERGPPICYPKMLMMMSDHLPDRSEMIQALVQGREDWGVSDYRLMQYRKKYDVLSNILPGVITILGNSTSD